MKVFHLGLIVPEVRVRDHLGRGTATGRHNTGVVGECSHLETKAQSRGR